MTKIVLLEGDIATQQVDAIVSAANPFLRGGGGVDGAIHRAAGPELIQACRAFPDLPNQPAGVPVRCLTGEAQITPAFNLPAKYVIHAVGPVYKNYSQHQAWRLLASAYAKSLQLAIENDCKTMAFPALSCGLYGFPVEEAAFVATQVLQHPKMQGKIQGMDEIRFVLYTEEILHEFERVFATLVK